MAAPEGYDPPLPDDLSDEIGQQLQLTLVELIACHSPEAVHWNAYGREFLSTHRHLRVR
jgi:DNA-binding ferritin-like protein